MTNGVLSSGTYNLINGGAALGVGSLTMNLDLPIPAGGVTRQSFALVRPASGTTPGFVHLVVTNNAASLTWSGTSGATWNLGTTADWSPAASGTFYDLDTVTFNDMDGNGTSGAVVLSGTLAPNIAYVIQQSYQLHIQWYRGPCRQCGAGQIRHGLAHDQ